ncbi:hypothetical protein HPB50_026027 [Hyalomma asiaticum]|uniref:Uncharacterized protein n=1 Tax=Hyalomma asiaticum TaxID=266040 RepID=A0ACB7TRG2_HYAAI|nr:hypothetical protein HPB50_026027 [Hyalomma asiaticum]
MPRNALKRVGQKPTQACSRHGHADPKRHKSPLRGPKANEKQRGPKPWHVSRLCGKPSSAHLREDPKPRGLPFKSMSPPPSGKENSKPRVLPRKSTPRPTPLPRERSPSPRPKHVGKSRARASQPVLPALPQRRRVSPPVPKAEGKTRALPAGPVHKSLSTKHPGTPPNPRPMSGESPHALSKVPASQPKPLVDGKLMSAKQSPVPVCHQVPGNKNQVAAARLGAESSPSSKVEPPAKNKAEQYMSRVSTDGEE